MLGDPDATPVRGVRRVLAGFPALHHRNFRLFMVGQGVSLIGFWMQSVAQGWLVYRLHENALHLGFVSFAGYLPILCLSPLGGVLADRLPRRATLVVTQTLLMLLAAGLGTLVALGIVTVPLVVCFAAGVGLVSALDVPARQSFLVEMVGPEDLPNAIALNSSIFNGARVIGPAIAGTVVAVRGEAACFFLNAASYVAVLVALLRMRLPPQRAAPATERLGAGFVDGLRYVWRTAALRNLLLLLGVVCGLGVQYMILMPVVARGYDAGAAGYGLLLTAGGVGSVLSSLELAARRYSRVQHRQNLLIGLVLFAFALSGLALSRRIEVGLVFQLLAGFGMVRYLATTNTLLQLLVEERYRGRMMGLHTVMFLGTQPFGGLVLGALARRYGAATAVCVSAVVAAGAAGWLGVRLRRLALRERAAVSIS